MKVAIEAGANDGLFQSRSLALNNDPNYQIILVEPSPDMYRSCCINRPVRTKVYHAALVSKDYQGDKLALNVHHQFSAMNTSKPCAGQHYIATVEVPARTLQSILDENGISEVEWLFLDTEGYEMEVLKGIDFSRTIIHNMEIEGHYAFIGLTEEEELRLMCEYLSPTHKLVRVLKGDGFPKAVFQYNKHE